MKLRLSYSNNQLEACVEFISTHNLHYLGQKDHIRQSIRGNMFDLARRFPNCTYLATMGYSIECFIEAEEGMDEDRNVLRFEFYVDPSVSRDIDTVTEDITILQDQQ